ncbi:MAG: 3-deoxy-D-manno-octulosonic acid transferase [Candidatus Omnitrophota bacterium]
MNILYDIIFFFFVLFYFPILLVKGKWHAGMWSRFGFLSELRLPEDVKTVWVHAVSVGEVQAVSGLIRLIKEQYPEVPLVMTTVTPTGNGLARKLFPDDIVLYAPLDFSFSVRRYLKNIRPAVYIAAETEIWPNLFTALFRRRIPVAIVNGRISDKSLPRYKRVRPLIRGILSRVDCFAMQSESDRRRVIGLGARPDYAYCAGNMKFDMDGLDGEYIPAAPFSQEGPVWVAGSTHPGEEEVAADIYQRIKPEFPALKFILAPRHIERADQVADLLSRRGMRFIRLSQCLQRPVGEDVLLVDTIGHLRRLYAWADVVFVGKSLTGSGGQNMIEPAAYARPVIVGPHTENFRASMDLLEKAGGILRVQSSRELEQALRSLLADPHQARELGRRAREAVNAQKGATRRTLQHLYPILTRCVFRTQR